MAKIGTAHVEIKPVLNDEALEQIATRIEAAVRAGVEAGMKSARGIDYVKLTEAVAQARPLYGDVHVRGEGRGGS